MNRRILLHCPCDVPTVSFHLEICRLTIVTDIEKIGYWIRQIIYTDKVTITTHKCNINNNNVLLGRSCTKIMSIWTRTARVVDDILTRKVRTAVAHRRGSYGA